MECGLGCFQRLVYDHIPEVGSLLPGDLTHGVFQSFLACLYAGARRSVLLNQDKLIML